MGKRVVLVGVGHVFDIAPQIKEVVEYVKPDIVTLELDKRRFHTLLFQESGKNVPFFYKLLGKMQENIAKKYGVETGSEMLAAVEKAEELDIPVECIDMDAQRVFLKLWKNMPLRKKVSLIIGGVTGLFLPKKKVQNPIYFFFSTKEVLWILYWFTCIKRINILFFRPFTVLFSFHSSPHKPP